jgi:hypothetical protein
MGAHSRSSRTVRAFELCRQLQPRGVLRLNLCGQCDAGFALCRELVLQLKDEILKIEQFAVERARVTGTVLDIRIGVAHLRSRLHWIYGENCHRCTRTGHVPRQSFAFIDNQHSHSISLLEHQQPSHVLDLSQPQKFGFALNSRERQRRRDLSRSLQQQTRRVHVHLHVAYGTCASASTDFGHRFVPCRRDLRADRSSSRSLFRVHKQIGRSTAAGAPFLHSATSVLCRASA